MLESGALGSAIAAVGLIWLMGPGASPVHPAKRMLAIATPHNQPFIIARTNRSYSFQDAYGSESVIAARLK
jgi:hypothetical protein